MDKKQILDKTNQLGMRINAIANQMNNAMMMLGDLAKEIDELVKSIQEIEDKKEKK